MKNKLVCLVLFLRRGETRIYFEFFCILIFKKTKNSRTSKRAKNGAFSAKTCFQEEGCISILNFVHIKKSLFI